MTISEYREITADTEFTDERVQQRIDFIRALCSNVIREELQRHKDKIVSVVNDK
jgi:hypothetical protein